MTNKLDVAYGYEEEEKEKGSWLDQIIAYLHDKETVGKKKVSKVV